MGKESTCNAGDAGDAGLTLGEEDPLEEKRATHSRFLAWRIPWTEEPGRLVHGVAELGATERLSTLSLSPHSNVK